MDPTLLAAGCRALAQQFGIAVAPETLQAAAAERTAADARFPIDPAALASAELCLVLACLQGNPEAQAALNRLLRPHLLQVIASLAPSTGRDELWQLAQVHLFVGLSEARPALAGYGGRGSLVKWARVTTRRALINATRRKALATDSLDDDALVERVAVGLGDPARSVLTARYHDAFRRAFRRAAHELPLHDRSLIRHAVVDQLTVRQVGRIFDVHHATAARWVAQAYARLVEATRVHLAAELVDDPRGVDDVLSLIKSQLDVSFAAFADEPDPR